MDKMGMISEFENLPGYIGIFTWDGTCLRPRSLSRQLSAMLGEEPIRCADSVVHPDDLGELNMCRFLEEPGQLACSLRLFDCSKGGYSWFRMTVHSAPGEDGTWSIYAGLVNIDEEKQMEAQLAMAERTLSSVIENSEIQFWEYDLKTDKAYLGLQSRKDYNMGDVIENFPASWIKTGYIHPDDVKEYLLMTKKLKSGIEGVTFDTRVWNQVQEKYEWKRIEYTTVFDEEKKPIKAMATALDIRDYKDSEETLQAVMEQVGISSWEYDIDRKVILHNRSGHGVFDENDLITKDIPDSLIAKRGVHPEDAEVLKQGYDLLFTGENHVKFQCRYWVSRIAQYRWFETAYTVIRDEDGRLLKAIGTARDIEEEKRAEEQYQDQLKYMNDVSDEALIAKGRHNITKNMVEFSVEKSSCAVVAGKGERYDSFTAKLTRRALRKEKQDELAEILSRKNLIDGFAKGVTKFSLEYERKTKDHRTVWVQTTLRTFMQPGSNDIVCFIYTYDTTDHVLQQHIVNRVIGLEYDFLAILDVETKHFRLITVNGTENVGVEAASIDYTENYLYESCGEVLPEQQQQVIENLRLGSILEKLSRSNTCFFTFSTIENGQVRRKKLQVAFLDDGCEFIMFTRTDITAIYKAEQAQLQRIESALKEAEEANQAKTDFLSRVSHDLRTPMNAILGLSNLGMESANLAEVKSYLEKIQSSGQYLLSLINDTLDVNKIESNRIEIHSALMSGRDLLEPVISTGMILAKERGVDFVADTSGMSSGMIKGDGIHIRRILNNLISNAIKFTSPGKQVEFRAEEKGAVLSQNKVRYCFSVEDQGIGMSEDFMRKMYEPFAQENEIYHGERGSGLGLTIVQKLVLLLGGEIEVASAVGKGSCFRIYLDLEKCEGFDGEDVAGLGKASIDALSGKHILVCEDHPLNTLVVKKLLAKVGCTITTAENGKVGVEIFSRAPAGTFDAILMDIRMPVMNGLVAAKKIRRMDEEIPIIALSANAYDIDEEKSADAGMNAHLSKPVEPQLMYETLLKYMTFRG